jgi:hypothetical protein
VPARTVPIDGFITHFDVAAPYGNRHLEVGGNVIIVTCLTKLLSSGNPDEKMSQWADAIIKARAAYHYHRGLHPGHIPI